MNDPIWDFNMRVGDCAYFHAVDFDVHVRICAITVRDGEKLYVIRGPRDQMVKAGYNDDFEPNSSTEWMVNIADPDELSLAPPIRPTLIGK